MVGWKEAEQSPFCQLHFSAVDYGRWNMTYYFPDWHLPPSAINGGVVCYKIFEDKAMTMKYDTCPIWQRRLLLKWKSHLFLDDDPLGGGHCHKGTSTPSAPHPECEQSRQCWPLSPKNGSDHISNWMTSNTNGAFLFVSMLPRTQQETTHSPKYTLHYQAYTDATFMVSGKLPLAVWHLKKKYISRATWCNGCKRTRAHIQSLI